MFLIKKPARQALSVMLLLFIFAGGFVLQAHAQTAEEIAARKIELQKQLDAVEAQIAQTQNTLTTLKGEGQSIQRDISILDAGIKKAQLQIKATQIEIQALAQNITIHARTADTLTQRINIESASLAQILRQTQQIDDSSIVEVALSADNVSNFFGDLDSFTSIKQQLAESSQILNNTRTKTLSAKELLESQKKQQEKLKAIQAGEQQKIVDQQNQKKKLLAQKKSETATYQSIFDVQQRTAAQIRAELFGLAGGGGAIPFGTAVDNAKIASRVTGVRPALILAILSQESDLGKNVGQCLITDLVTGDGKGKNTGTPRPQVMAVLPRRDDTGIFKRILDALGRDWRTTPISCDQPGGYGGAMGPTQFIPSTWVLYENRIKSGLGIANTDPWNPLHAIMATGLLLADNGATGGSYAAEHTAAAKYYAGGNWASSGQTYANSVMDKAAKFQADIDTLGG